MASDWEGRLAPSSSIYDQTMASQGGFPAPVITGVTTGYVTKDSGARDEYASGMVRDTQDDKARFDLMRPKNVPYAAQFLTRVAELMTRGAKKYGFRNWEQANSQDELERFENSAERHLQQYLAGETDEDHAAAVVFNLLAAETLRWKLGQQA